MTREDAVQGCIKVGCEVALGDGTYKPGDNARISLALRFAEYVADMAEAYEAHEMGDIARVVAAALKR